MTAKGKQKIFGFFIIWLVLFVIVKSIEKILLITLVVAIGYGVSRLVRTQKKTKKNL